MCPETTSKVKKKNPNFHQLAAQVNFLARFYKRNEVQFLPLATKVLHHLSNILLHKP